MKTVIIDRSPFDPAWNDGAARKRFFGYDLADGASFATLMDALKKVRYEPSALAAILEKYNDDIGAGDRARENIRALAGGGFAVVTGQQPCLLGGPLYTVYKIATAIRLARALSASLSVPVVPVFWNASNDSDVSEVDHAFVSRPDGTLKRYAADLGRPRLLSSIPSSVVRAAVDEFLHDRNENDNAPVLAELLRTSENGFARDVSSFYVRLFAPFGLVAVEPMHLNTLAPAFFGTALNRHDAVRSALSERVSALAAHGLPVPIRDIPSTTVFGVENDIRSRISIDGDAIIAGNVRHPLSQARAFVDARIQNMTCDVFSRIMFQQYAIPSLAYIAGPSEFNYLAEAASLSEVFGIPMPVIYPRASVTLLEDKFARIQASFGMSDDALFGGYEAFKPHADSALTSIVERFSSASAAFVSEMNARVASRDAAFERTTEQFGRRLREDVDRLAEKAERSLTRAEGVDTANLSRLRGSVLPREGYQERTLGIAEFIHRHGIGIIGDIVEGITIGGASHQLLRL
ncbi:MAG: bacillithiol biosynthesis cysteine-adding enzyme BshC [Spirochaetota bacterium]